MLSMWAIRAVGNTNSYIFFMHCSIVLEPKKIHFLGCTGLKGLNNTDSDTNNLGPSAQVYLYF